MSAGTQHNSLNNADLHVPADHGNEVHTTAFAEATHTHTELHEHTDLTALNKISESGGQITFDGDFVAPQTTDDLTEGSTNLYQTVAEKAKLAGIEAGATADQTDAEIKTAYENNADTNAFTDAEKAKLTGIEDNHFKGLYVSEAALSIAHPTAAEGDYAYVDAGVGQPTTMYVWDVDDTTWRLTGNTAETPASIKSKYESNADTNAYTDAEKVVVGNTSSINTGDQTQDTIPNISDIDGTTTKDALNTINLNQECVSGFDRSDPDSMGTPSWVDATRTFTLAVTGGRTDFRLLVKGVEQVFTTSISVQIPDVSGSYYFYITSTGTYSYILEANITAATFYENNFFGGVYWNAIEGIGLPWEERHGKRRSIGWHLAHHTTVGATYSRGLLPTGFVAGNTTYTNMTSGVFYDEDIMHYVASDTTHPFFYREGLDGPWKASVRDNEYGFKEGGDTYYSWNENVAGTWQLTEGGSSTDYFIMFMVAAPALTTPICGKIIGQNGYSSANNARAAIETELYSLQLEGLPSPEFKFLFAYIVKRDGELQTIDGTEVYYPLYKEGRGGGSPVGTASGDVVGPVTATDNAIVRFDTATGKLIQDSSATVSDTGIITASGIDSTPIGGTTPSTIAGTTGTFSGDVTTGNLPAPNLLINADGTDPLDQRGSLPATSVTSDAYTADRWRVLHSETAVDVSMASGYFRTTITTAASGYCYTLQDVEDFTKYANTTLTISARVRSNNPNAKVGIWDGATEHVGASHSGGGDWEILTATANLTTVTALWGYIQQSTSNFNGAYAEFEWIKLEVGSVATPFVADLPGVNLAKCQRYCQKIGYSTVVASLGFRGVGLAGTQMYNTMTLPVTMRTNPTYAVQGTWVTGNCTAPAIGGAGPSAFNVIVTPTADGDAYTYNDSVDDGFIFYAEL